jgi:signal transduction histidine kinase
MARRERVHSRHALLRVDCGDIPYGDPRSISVHLPHRRDKRETRARGFTGGARPARRRVWHRRALKVRLGLRERLVSLLAVVSALTLAVAAVALSSPLDHRLRTAALKALAQSLRSDVGDFTRLPAEALRPSSPRLLKASRPLRRTGADVVVLDGSGHVLLATDPDNRESFAAAHAALRSHRSQQRISGEGSQASAQVAIPVTIHGTPAVVAARRPLADVQDATAVVRRGLAVAAGAGLLGAILVGALIAGRTSRRIRRLRDTAERVAQLGPAAEFQPEAGRDEIGDLSRTFALMQARLREQDQAQRAFVATASHELRTPVTSLQVMLDLLISDLETEPFAVEDARQQARRADAQAARLSQLASELLDLSRLDAGLPLRREPFGLDEVLRSVISEMEVRLADQRRSVRIADSAARRALGDPSSAAAILRILLDNALRHTPPPGGVQIEFAARDERVGIAVHDQGPGVAADERERIFERFARGPQAQAGGFGLGLAIGRELARRMNGDLVLEETSAGARFVLWLPLGTPT